MHGRTGLWPAATVRGMALDAQSPIKNDDVAPPFEIKASFASIGLSQSVTRLIIICSHYLLIRHHYPLHRISAAARVTVAAIIIFTWRFYSDTGTAIFSRNTNE